MKCPKCKADLFNGQYQCHKCGAWIPSIKEDKKDKPKKATKKEK